MEGKILEKEIIRNDSSNPYRYSVKYLFQDDSNKTKVYIAKGNDHSLSRELNVGDLVKKSAGELNYIVNNKPTVDFPIKFYALMLGIGIIFLLFSWSYLIPKAVRIFRS